MNQSLKNVLIFLSGAAAGGVSIWLVVKKYYELKADHEIESVRDAYNNRIADYEPVKSSADGELEGPETIEEASEEDVRLGKTKSSIVKELVNKPPLTDYTKYFKAKENGKTLNLKETLRDAKEDAKDIDPAELERPEDDEPYDDEEEHNQQVEYEGYQLNGAKDKAYETDREPYEIDKAAYELECTHYEKQELLWYASDNTLTNDINEFVDEDLLIGDILDNSGFVDNDQEAIWVRNDKLMVDFEIRKLYTAFNEE